MGLIRKQIRSDSPRHQVDEWFVKYSHHKVLSEVFYYPDKVLFKVLKNHSYVMRQLMELYMCDELNKFVVFDFGDTYNIYTDIEINTHSGGPHNIGPHYVAKVMSMMDKHLLNVNEIFVHDCSFDGNYKTFVIKRYGSGDWRVEPDQE